MVANSSVVVSLFPFLLIVAHLSRVKMIFCFLFAVLMLLLFLVLFLLSLLWLK